MLKRLREIDAAYHAQNVEMNPKRPEHRFAESTRDENALLCVEIGLRKQT